MPTLEQLHRQLADVHAQLAQLADVHSDCGRESVSPRRPPSLSDAISVMESMREQPGVVPMYHGDWQYLIEATAANATHPPVLEIRKRRDAAVKMTRSFSPAFNTEQAARNAINAIGEDKILSAMKTLAWG